MPAVFAQQAYCVIWLQDSRHLTEVTTIYGETVQAPLVYVEMLQFWRRYEPRP
jgi:hypothetical protein